LILDFQLFIQLFVSLTYFLLIPGLPVALAMSDALKRPHIGLALTPFLSLSTNFVILYVLNFLGVRPPLLVYAVLLLLLSLFILRQRQDLFLSTLRVNIQPLLAVIPAAAVSFYLWATSFANYNFAAANQDAFNHNLWIARIAQVKSVLASDSFVSSPLQGLDTGSGFYPFSWHSAVAVAHHVGSVPIPILSLATTIILWGVVLPLGLTALASEIAPQIKSVGLIAGVLVQLFPLVPGVPMSWGSMTSVNGIALLPIGFLIMIIAFEKSSVSSSIFAIFTFISFIFIHTPAAATLGVLTVSASVAYWRRVNIRVLIKFFLAISVSMVPILFLFQSYIFSENDEIKSLWGAVYPFWDKAIGAFILLNVNVPNDPIILTLLFVFGIGYVGFMRFSPTLLLGMLGIFVTYLISGAPSGILNNFRIVTTPWYASYERTAWVAVPFVALICAFPIAAILNTPLRSGFVRRTVGLMLVSVLMLGIFRQQVDVTKDQLAKGPQVSAVIGKEDRPLLQRLKKTLETDEIVFSFGNDGSTYAFMYEEILTTSGQTFNRFGEKSAFLAVLYRDIRTICNSPEAQLAITTEKIGAFVFGSRLLGWGPPGWQREEIESLGGMRLVDSGKYLFVTVPDFSTCQSDT
jgi:hypothetical protein